MAQRSRKWGKVTTIYNFKNLKTVRVFGIARVSTDKQAKHGESLAHQKEVLANWVKAKSSINAPQEWKLVEVYVENEDKDGSRRGRSAPLRAPAAPESGWPSPAGWPGRPRPRRWSALPRSMHRLDPA